MSPRRPRPLSGALVAVVLAAGTAACGLPTDDQPVLLDDGQVSFGLTRELNTAAPSFPENTQVAPATLFLVEPEQDKLRRVTRRIPTPVNLDTVMANLMAGGVTKDEGEGLGLANPVPDGELRSIKPGTAGGAPTATVIEVKPDFFERLGAALNQRLVIGQLVLTAAAASAMGGQPIERIQFKSGDSLEPVPNGEGAFALTVECRDYEVLLVDPAESPCPQG